MTKMRTLPGTLALAAMAACATVGTRMGSAGGDVMIDPVDAPVSSVTALPSAATMNSMTPPAAVPSSADLVAAYSRSAPMSVNQRVAILDNRAAVIDRLPFLGYNELNFDDEPFADLYHDWKGMQRWNDADGVRKIRVLPALDRNDTEEFYYEDGRLIMAYRNPLGTFDHESFCLPGESFYFGEEGLIAWMRGDGTSVSPSHPDFQYWDKQLRNRAKRLAAID